MQHRQDGGMTTLDIARTLGPELIALRRELHQTPELGLHLPVTQQKVLAELEGLDLEVHTGEGLSSVTAVLRGTAVPRGQGPVVLLRGDMDALPVTEAVEVPYRSRNIGQMHACGHDLHTAGLVGAARILSQLREQVAGDVVFMFQPGEEGPGGAEPMLAEGLLSVAGRPVDAAFALHVSSSEYPRGQWFSRPRELMAGVDRVEITVTGAGGHGSQPHRALDPIPALCEVVLALQSMVTRSFSAFDSVVLTVGRIAAGTADNIIPDNGGISATLRTFTPETRQVAMDGIRRVAAGVAAAHGLTVDVAFSEGYPATINDDAEYALALETTVDLFGAERFTERPTPEMGSEDMSFVMERVPGAYFFISACASDDYDTAPDNHSPRAEFDDSVVPDAAAWLAEVAIRRLRQATTGS
jgi:hippurate hydrolase